MVTTTTPGLKIMLAGEFRTGFRICDRLGFHLELIQSFGLAISAHNIYALMVSTHHASTVTADDGGPVYYQQQVLAKVPRIGFGAAY